MKDKTVYGRNSWGIKYDGRSLKASRCQRLSDRPTCIVFNIIHMKFATGRARMPDISIMGLHFNQLVVAVAVAVAVFRVPTVGLRTINRTDSCDA